MNSLKNLLVFLLCVFVFTEGQAVALIQPPPPPGLPIDGGLSFLVLSGVLYGLYESLRRK